MRQGGFYFYFYSAKNRCGNLFFLKLRMIFFQKLCLDAYISLDIIQVRPLNLIVKASAHQVDLTSSLMKVTKAI